MTALGQILSGPGLFRFSLALLVFVHHTTRVSLGASAVYIFFELSGYWICTMWNGRYAKAAFPFGVYIVSRAWRLMPVFVLCAVISWAVLFALKRPLPVIDWPQQALSNIFILGYSSLDFQANRPAWTLDIEMQFYLIAPLLILFMRWRIWLALIACIDISLVGYLLDYPFAAQAHPYTLTPHPITFAPYLIFFSIGVAAASANWRPSRAVGLGALVGTSLLVLAIIATPLRGLILGGAHPDALYHRFNESANVVVALLMAPWAIYTTRQKGARNDSVLGDLSYIVYLLQWPVLEVLNPAIGATGHRALVALEALGVVLLGSLAIWRLVDHPINRARSGWVARQIVPAPAAVAAARAGSIPRPASTIDFTRSSRRNLP